MASLRRTPVKQCRLVGGSFDRSWFDGFLKHHQYHLGQIGVKLSGFLDISISMNLPQFRLGIFSNFCHPYLDAEIRTSDLRILRGLGMIMNHPVNPWLKDFVVWIFVRHPEIHALLHFGFFCCQVFGAWNFGKKKLPCSPEAQHCHAFRQPWWWPAVGGEQGRSLKPL